MIAADFLISMTILQACVITRSRLQTLDTWLIGTPGYNHSSQTHDADNSYNKVLGVRKASFSNLALSAQNDNKLYFRPNGDDSMKRTLTGSKGGMFNLIFFIILGCHQAQFSCSAIF